MVRHSPAAVLSLFCFVAAVGAEEAPPLPEELLGEWVVVAAEYRGERPSAEIVAKLAKFPVVVQGDKLPLPPLSYRDDSGFFIDAGGPLAVRCRAKTSAAPKEIELVLQDGNVEFRMLGIYAVEGKRLQLCWQHDGRGRPKEFRTTKEPSQMMFVLERAAKGS